MPVTDAAGRQAILSRGYAQVHEDDTERAMRPGLESVVTVAGLNALVPSQTRVGTAQGFCCHGRADRTGWSAAAPHCRRDIDAARLVTGNRRTKGMRGSDHPSGAISGTIKS